jgi:two-component system cell cycle response regulator
MSLGKDTAESILFGEFRNRTLEQKYLNHEIGSSLKYVKLIIIMTGILFFLFFIPDYFMAGSKQIFYKILLIRSGFFVMVLLFSWKIQYFKSCYSLVNWITAFEILASLSFLYICYSYESPTFLRQSFGVILIILIVFWLPNRWINMVLISAGLIIGFFVYSTFHFREAITSIEISAAAFYIMLIVIMSSITSCKNNYFKRIQYLNSKRLIELSAIDPLTGVYNRAKFDKELEKWVAISKRYRTPLSLIIFDIDNLKIINDNYGHLVGDQILIVITKIIRNAIRETDLLARWGGDEFMLLLTNTSEEDAVQLAQRLRKLIAGHKFGKIGYVSGSFGVTMLAEDEDSTSFFYRADQMLYLAKKAGKNQVTGDQERDFNRKQYIQS